MIVIVEKIACTRPLASGGSTHLSLPLAPGQSRCQWSDESALANGLTQGLRENIVISAVIYRRRSAIPACEALRN